MPRQKIEVSREAIITQAAKLFGDQGYRKTRLEDVAAHFNITRAALYYHFKNKQEILVVIHLQAIRGLVDGADAIIAGNERVDRKFAKVLEYHMAFVARNAAAVRVLNEDQAELPPKAFRQVQELRRLYTDKLITLYRSGMRAGYFRKGEPKLIVFALLGACNWICRWYREQGKYDADDIAAMSIQILAGGYLLPH